MSKRKEVSARTMLKRLNEWAKKADASEVNNLWMVLSALRGPDSGSYYVKHKTTAVIRKVAVPDFAYKVGMDVRHEEMTSAAIPSDHGRHKDGHFYQHVRLAKRALIEMGL